MAELPRDLLDVRDRPDIGFTSEAPKSHLSQSQLEQPGRDMAAAMEKWSRAAAEGGAALERGAVTAAERQAYGDLAKQKVTRDTQGNIQVLNPANSFFWGEAGRRYEDIVRQGTSASAGLLLNQSMVEAAARNPLDPAKFKANSDAILDTFQQGPLGQTAAGAEALLHGRQRQIEHLDSITNRSALIDVENQKKTILDGIEDQKNTMIGLARQNGTDSPEFKSAMDKYVAANQSLTSNPLFKVPQASVDLDIKNTRALMQGEALTERVDETYNKKGKAEADAILKKDILENPDLKESDRSRLYAQGKSRLAFLTADQQAGFEADKETLSYLRKGIAEGTIPADGPVVKEARDRFERNHSTQAVSDLDAILQAYPHVKAQQSIPGGIQTPASSPSAIDQSYYNKLPRAQDPYARIPAKGEHGEDQLARFRQWNPDPIGNSAANLASVHPDLQAIVRKAQGDNPNLPFVVALGKSTPEQEKLAQSWGWGQAGTGGSHHLEGNTVDLWPLDKEGHVVFDKDKQQQISQAMQKAAGDLGLSVRWGGLTSEGGQNKSFRDAPNFELLNPKERVQSAAFTPGPMPTGGQNAGQYQPAINAAAQKYGIDPSILTRQLYQENGFRTTGTSPAGAQGFAQFIPSTAARYGVNVNDPNSSIEGAAHYMSDLIKRYNGNVGLALAGYNWGENNVDRWIGRTGSTTSQGGGYSGVPRETQQYVQAITGHSIEEWRKDPNLKVRGGVMSAAADGGMPFTATQIDANPFLLSEWVRAQASDQEDKTAHLSAVVSAMKETVRGGNMPPDESLAMVTQAAERDPGKYGMLAAEAEGIKAAAVSIGGGGGAPMTAPQREAYEQGLTSLVNGQDLYHQKLANTALELMRAQDQHAKDAPLTAYAQRYGLPAPPPIDPGHPETIGSVLGARGVLAQHIGALNQSEAPGLLERGDGQKLAGAFQGQGGAAVLSSIASSVRPQDLQRLADEPAFRDSVTAMARSGDPAKMNSAFSMMDKLQQQNPLDFDAKWKDGLKDLRSWQSSLSYYPPDEAAKRMMREYDPSMAKAMDQAKVAADDQLKTVTPAQIVRKFSTGLPFVPFSGVTAQTPVGEMNGVAAQSLKDDYAQNYRDGFAATGDQTMADKFAMEKLNLKYGVSSVNANRVTAYPPERYYPQVNGSYDWMGKQLDDEIRGQLGLPSGLQRGQAFASDVFGHQLSEQEQAQLEKFNAPRALIPDSMTEADIANNRPPSYGLVIQGPDGRFRALTGPSAMPMRFRFDPGPARDRLTIQKEQQRTDVGNVLNSLQGLTPEGTMQ